MHHAGTVDQVRRMNNRETPESPESDSSDTGNVTRLDDIRRTRQAAQNPVDATARPIDEDTGTDTPDRETKSPTKKNRRFNREKVEELKAAIASGDYKVDAERVAHKFIEHDRH